MQQIWIPRHGGPEVLEVREAPDPEPGPGEVRVQVEAAGINFADLMARMGVYPDAPPVPMVVGYEVAGTIDAVGSGVSEERIGDPVIAATKFGGYSSAIIVADSSALKRPEGLDACTAASIPVTGLTAWMMLEEMGRVREGDRVLVHSAAGGVGLMCLELCLYRGAIAVGTASAGKHDFLRERGYHQLIDYRTQDFHEVLKDGPKFDLVLDPIGGKSWTQGYDLLRRGGRLIMFGASSMASGSKRSMGDMVKIAWNMPWLAFGPLKLIDANKGVLGVNMLRMFSEQERLSGWLDKLIDRWEEGKLRPHVHKAFRFADAADAHQFIHDRKNIGKVVLVSPRGEAGAADYL